MADLKCGGRLIVVAFDPGETTGYARLSLSKRLLRKEGTSAALSEMCRNGRWRHGQFGTNPGKGRVLDEEGSADHMLRLTRLGWVEEIREEDSDTFVTVVEDFVLFRSEKSRNLLAPVRLTARFEQLLSGSGVRLVKQSASDAKGVVTDARLRRWHVFDDQGDSLGRHSRDAMRHAILFARKWSSRLEVRSWAGEGRLE